MSDVYLDYYDIQMFNNIYLFPASKPSSNPNPLSLRSVSFCLILTP